MTLIALANAIVNLLATDVVTANAAANGSLTVGNGYVSGIFGSSILVAGSIRGGNVQSSANLIISSNVFVNASSLYVGNSIANSSMNSINLTVPTVTVVNASVQYFPQANLTFANASLNETDLVTTGTGQVVLDSFLLTTYRTAEYLVQVTDNNANNHQSSKILVTHAGGSAISTEYAQLVTNTTLATFTASVNATSLILQVTPASTNTTIRTLRISLNS